MRIYEVEFEERYWVAAKDMRQALDVVRQGSEAGEITQGLMEVEALSLKVVPEDQARVLRIHDDELGGDRSLWDFFRDQREKGSPGMMASSEWV